MDNKECSCLAEVQDWFDMSHVGFVREENVGDYGVLCGTDHNIWWFHRVLVSEEGLDG